MPSCKGVNSLLDLGNVGSLNDVAALRGLVGDGKGNDAREDGNDGRDYRQFKERET
jgi:hypothetical protein